MSHTEHVPNPHVHPPAAAAAAGTPGHQIHHRPYWRRAHRDWRVWACGMVMIVALMIYLTNYEMPWWPRDHPRQPMMAPAGN